MQTSYKLPPASLASSFTRLQLHSPLLIQYNRSSLFSRNGDIELNDNYIVTAGVEISGLNLIYKADPTQCSQTVRRNVTEGSNTKFVERAYLGVLLQQQQQFGRPILGSSNASESPQAPMHPDQFCLVGSVLEKASEVDCENDLHRRHMSYTNLFKEPSKYDWSDSCDDHFLVLYQRMVLITSKRVILLQSLSLENSDRKLSKIGWEVPWEELLAQELAKSSPSKPSHLIIHLKHFRTSEGFAQIVRCNIDEEEENIENKVFDPGIIFHLTSLLSNEPRTESSFFLRKGRMMRSTLA